MGSLRYYRKGYLTYDLVRVPFLNKFLIYSNNKIQHNELLIRCVNAQTIYLLYIGLMHKHRII